mgnify:CR=1 FL=1
MHLLSQHKLKYLKLQGIFSLKVSHCWQEQDFFTEQNLLFSQRTTLTKLLRAIV